MGPEKATTGTSAPTLIERAQAGAGERQAGKLLFQAFYPTADCLTRRELDSARCKRLLNRIGNIRERLSGGGLQLRDLAASRERGRC